MIGIVVVAAVASILVLDLTLPSNLLPQVIPGFEKLQITSAITGVTETGGTETGVPVFQYALVMTVNNTGILPARLDPTAVFLNGKPTSAYATEDVRALFNGTSAPLMLWPGDVADVTVTLSTGTDFVLYMGVEVMLRTTAGDLIHQFILIPAID